MSFAAKNSLIGGLFLVTLLATGSAFGSPLHLDFEDVPPGRLPAGWVVAATRGQGPLATWAVVADASAPSGGRVLALIRTNHHSGATFNLCWDPGVSFRDGRVSVRLKAISGEEDQGGGVMWRMQDANNYYVARFNPLEDNFRLYRVHQGQRHMLASARVHLSPGWHILAIAQRGDHYAGYLDGHHLLEGRDDTFPKAGGVGLWTKADAVTAFDDFQVAPVAERPEGQP